MNPYAPPLPEAPGAKAARVCGILAILFAITCVGIPVGIILGIVALVKQSKAKNLARQFPDQYGQPSGSGLVLGIIGLVMPVLMLPILGIVSAIAIPALLGQRTRARDRAAIANLQSKLPELVERYGRNLETGATPMVIKAELEGYLLGQTTEKNPYNLQAPAFRYTVGMSPVSSTEEMAAAAEAQATTVGEVVFVMSAPADPQAPHLLAAAVRTQMPVNGATVYTRVVPIN